MCTLAKAVFAHFTRDRLVIVPLQMCQMRYCNDG